jgi:hypothetical protein
MQRSSTEPQWPRYPRILVPIDKTPAAGFALRHVTFEPFGADIEPSHRLALALHLQHGSLIYAWAGRAVLSAYS